MKKLNKMTQNKKVAASGYETATLYPTTMKQYDLKFNQQLKIIEISKNKHWRTQDKYPFVVQKFFVLN